MPSQMYQIPVHRTRIIVPETLTNEDQLRNLLKQEREKNVLLNLDYKNLQKRNLNLMECLNNVETENKRLREDNQNLHNAIKTSRNSVLFDHNYY